jgi:hypothetical protein
MAPPGSRPRRRRPGAGAAPTAIAAALVAALVTAGCAAVRPGGRLLDRYRLQITGETAKVRRDEAPPLDSAIFDGQRVRLRLVRGETAGVMVHRAGAAPVTLAIDAPAGALAIGAFDVGYMRVRLPSTRLFGTSRGPGEYPDILRPVDQPVTSADAALFDVAIAGDAPPGAYAGEVTVAGLRYPLELTIEPLTIDPSHRPLVWVWFKRAELGRQHGLAPDDRDPRWRALEDAYAALFRAHATFLTTDPMPGDAAASPLRTPDLPYFPIRIREDHVEEDVARALEVFGDGTQVPFIIPIDEPRDVHARLRARRIGERVHAAGGGPGRLLMAVTDRPRWIYGDSIDVFISPQAVPVPPAFAGRALTWTYNGRPPEAGALIHDTTGVAPRTWGWIGARYHLALWYAWEGLYYTDRYNLITEPTDVMTDPVTYDQRHLGGRDFGNGDGVLAYPGPLPSLRLKAMRRGLLDRLLVELLRACPAGAAEAERIVRAVVPRALGEAGPRPSWPADEPGFERARHAILDRLVEGCADPR